MDCYQSVDEAYEDGTNRLEALLSRLHCLNMWVMRLGRFSVFHYISTIFFHCFLFYWLINHLCSPTLSSGSIKLNVGHFGSALQKSSISCEEYKHAVVQAKEHILAGDIFQVVLSQRFERRTFADPFEIYRALRIVNPSPYMAYLQVTGIPITFWCIFMVDFVISWLICIWFISYDILSLWHPSGTRLYSCGIKSWNSHSGAKGTLKQLIYKLCFYPPKLVINCSKCVMRLVRLRCPCVTVT